MSTLWFVPALFVIAGLVLGIAFIGVDYFFESPFQRIPMFFGVQPSGARDILAVIAGSSITVAGTVFSITIIALTLASTQFSPRILRNFMRDTGNQAVLGALVGIFAYCIVVLRTIRDGGDNPDLDFVPTTAVFFGVIFGFFGVGCLIYFIHHVATSIQASSIISAIAKETIAEVERTFPDESPEQNVPVSIEKLLQKPPAFTVTSNQSGYVQNADSNELKAIAAEYDLVIRMQRRIGQFAISGLPVLDVFSESDSYRPDESTIVRMRSVYNIGSYRTVEGDVAFGLRQLVDIALKALSPAVNDSTTAVTCVDYIGSIMVSIARKPSCPSHLYQDRQLRVVMEEQRFEDFFDLAFNQIRQNTGGNVAVILRLLNSINVLSKVNANLKFKEERNERHELIQSQADLLFALAQRTVPEKEDLRKVEKLYDRVHASLTETRSKFQ